MIRTTIAMKSGFGLVAALVMFLSVSQADAARFRLVAAADDAAAAEAAGPCCPDPCIIYRHIHKHGRTCCKCECKPPVKATLSVPDPCQCDCAYDVNVCLPACCTGEPTVCKGCDLLGRPTVTYSWCCGFTVKASFRRCGDLLVTSIGSLK